MVEVINALRQSRTPKNIEARRRRKIERVFQLSGDTILGFKEPATLLPPFRGNRFVHYSDDSETRTGEATGLMHGRDAIMGIGKRLTRAFFRDNIRGGEKRLLESLSHAGIRPNGQGEILAKLTDVFIDQDATENHIVHVVTAPDAEGRQTHVLITNKGAQPTTDRLSRYIEKLTGKQVKLVIH